MLFSFEISFPSSLWTEIRVLPVLAAAIFETAMSQIDLPNLQIKPDLKNIIIVFKIVFVSSLLAEICVLPVFAPILQLDSVYIKIACEVTRRLCRTPEWFPRSCSNFFISRSYFFSNDKFIPSRFIGRHIAFRGFKYHQMNFGNIYHLLLKTVSKSTELWLRY